MTLNRSATRRNDPTGQASRRRTATRSLTVRLSSAETQTVTLLNQTLNPERNVTRSPIDGDITIFYEYGLNSAEILALERAIRSIVNSSLGTIGDEVDPGWFWGDQIEPPYRDGAFEELNRTNQLITAAIAAGVLQQTGFVQPLTIPQVTSSVQYFINPINAQVAENYSTIKSLSDRTSASVIQQVNSGMAAGLSRRQIITNVRGRFDVGDSDAKRIADTEINRAYNDGKMNTGRLIRDRTGVRTAVLHISALLPTTRETHAARHGNVYTFEEQERWWDTGANRINCKCSTASALIDEDGNVIQTEDEETLIRERRFFEDEDFDFENS